MQDHSTNNYLSFQSTLGAQLDGGDAKYPLFDRGVFAPSSAPRQLHDPTDFLGLAHGIMSSEGTQANLHSRNGGDRSDELSGLVGGAGASSVTGPSGCKAIYSSVPPLLDRNGRRSPPAGVSTATTATAPVAATAAMRMQGVDSWVCSTSE
ncbi:hypothetical protein BAE44_0005716 [Dichanthelium oligosanthes]|uniref:Uncharacterized protein n=1 Tax=Dichanthelium oligosanthes TaxID=888268 RepID=A0A1E5W7G3_9POAL|nr:hypothetical protein BAE44_0005716 [Dichanthelium oligosanthes]